MKGPLRVLILENRASDAALIVHELRRHGFEPEWSRVETEAEFATALVRSPDIVLADYTLPQFNAPEALRLSKALRPDIPVIVVTGSVGEEAAVECLRLGAVDYLLKDRLARLGDAVDRALEGRRLQAERRRTEQSLRESEEKFRAIFEQARDVVFTLRPDGTFSSLNPSVEPVFGWAPADWVGRPFYELLHPDDVSRALRVHQAALSGEPVPSHELRVRTRSGEYLDVGFSLALMRRGGGIELLGLGRDVTERKRAEEALRRSEEKYRLFFELDLAGHFVTTPEGQLLTCNPSFARMFGFASVEEALAQNMTSLYADPGERVRFVEAVRTRGRVERYEKELRRPGGRPVHLVENAVGELDERGQLVRIRGIVLDETGRLEAEQELRQAQKIEAVGRLAGGIAHDFNNILSVILGYLDILQPAVGAGDPGFAELEEIRKAADRAAGLTRQLLAFSRRQVLQPEVLDLNEVVSDVDKMLRRLIGEDVRIETVLSPALSRVLADPGQIEQVIVNLAVNARDAMPKGGTLTIETSDVDTGRAGTELEPPAPPGAYVMLALSDTGCGMSAGTLSQIFEPFFTTKERGKGTGLGLPTVYGIVTQSGGYIRVESEPGRGSTFRVFLPRATAAGPSALPGTVTGPPLTGSETILLVEDDTALLAVTATMLTAVGYTVLPASRPEDALGLAASHPGPLHLLLTDVIMPGMSGPELATRLAAERPDLAILFMSGYTDGSVAPHGVLEPGIQFIQKPFDRSSLLQKIRATLVKKSRSAG